MSNKKFIITVVIILFWGTISLCTILYTKNNEIILPVTQTKIENTDKTEQIKDHINEKTWQKVGNGLYFDTKSVKMCGDYVEGIFKQYNINNEIQNGKIYSYAIIWVGAFCDIKLQDGLKKLDFPIYKYYDSNGNLLLEDNIHKAWAENYPDGHLGITYPEDVENGDIYFKVLSKYYKH